VASRWERRWVGRWLVSAPIIFPCHLLPACRKSRLTARRPVRDHVAPHVGRRPWIRLSFRAISDAPDQLAATDPALAEIVDLKFFRSFAELAAIRQVSERTVLRIREKARIYLYNAISATLDG
jgi:hypothetical protein